MTVRKLGRVAVTAALVVTASPARAVAEAVPPSDAPACRPVATIPAAIADFDGDHKSDLAGWNPVTGQWWIRPSTGLPDYGVRWGAWGDEVIHGDFDGDGRADVGVFRDSGGLWMYQASSRGSGPAAETRVTFGQRNDAPVPDDYDGDGCTDPAVVREVGGALMWYVLPSSGPGFYGFPYGLPGDKLAPGDYDGDGRADAAVFRPATGEWFIRYASTGQTAQFPFGPRGDVPAPADYTGDGRTDPAVLRRTEDGRWDWYFRRADGLFWGTRFGYRTDAPVPGDFNGDGRADVVVYRPLVEGSEWWLSIHHSDPSQSDPQAPPTEFRRHVFGTLADDPIAGSYVP